MYNGNKSFISLDELKSFCLSPGNIFIDKGLVKKDLKILNIELTRVTSSEYKQIYKWKNWEKLSYARLINH